ncbi:MAG: NAD(P)/FAD-dependent oxidoreductase [Gammaproteobacteria bacterium]|nr:NAD(P)/FAD-dependent oxidoreductase [Gammaproteobacteria bacterium]
MERFSVCIAGAGVIGLAIARQLAKSGNYPHLSILLLEQESDFGKQISSRNSEVIHAGIYYEPGSLKARLCVEGRQRLYHFCKSYGIACKQTGKCIVSQEKSPDALESLLLNARNNGVSDLEIWNQTTLANEEPAVTASYALFSPSTGIIDSHGFMQSLLCQAKHAGTLFVPRTKVREVRQNSAGFVLETETCGQFGRDNYQVERHRFISCAGVHAQSLATRLEGLSAAKIPPLYLCKGDYWRFKGKNPFKRLIYPMPEPNTAGLGIHSTQDLSGHLRFGPDSDYVEHLDYAVSTAKSASFIKAIRQYFPSITIDQLEPDYSGIRPKLIAPGQPPSDFVIQNQSDHGVANLIQLFGIESPGLTASLAIASYVEMLLNHRIYT